MQKIQLKIEGGYFHVNDLSYVRDQSSLHLSQNLTNKIDLSIFLLPEWTVFLPVKLILRNIKPTTEVATRKSLEIK